MMGLAAAFLMVALAAAALGYSGFAGELVAMAWVIAIVFVILFVATTVTDALTGRRRPTR
ncbi:hypothetical protein BH23CHL8_BH23CHL8_28400 [soil metagenome]